MVMARKSLGGPPSACPVVCRVAARRARFASWMTAGACLGLPWVILLLAACGGDAGTAAQGRPIVIVRVANAGQRCTGVSPRRVFASGQAHALVQVGPFKPGHGRPAFDLATLSIHLQRDPRLGLTATGSTGAQRADTPAGVRIELRPSRIRISQRRGGAEEWLVAFVPLAAAGQAGLHCVDAVATGYPGAGLGEDITGRVCGIDVGPPRDAAEERCELLRRVGELSRSGALVEALVAADELLARIDADGVSEPLEKEVALVEKAQAHRALKQWREAEDAYVAAAAVSARRLGGRPDPFFDRWLEIAARRNGAEGK